MNCYMPSASDNPQFMRTVIANRFPTPVLDRPAQRGEMLAAPRP